MLKKTIKYTDYNGVERNEDFFFNLSKAEIMDMQMGTTGGLTEFLVALVKTQNMPEIIRIFKEIILKSYGVKSADGRRFIKTNEKGEPLSVEFSQTEAFSTLYMELATDAKKAAEFVNGITPSDMEVSEEQQAATMKELFGDQAETFLNQAKEIESQEPAAIPENTEMNNTQN